MIKSITKTQLAILEAKRQQVRQLMQFIDAITKEGEVLLEIDDGDMNAEGAYPAADYVGDFIGDSFASEYTAENLCEALGIAIAGPVLVEEPTVRIYGRDIPVVGGSA